MGVQSEEETMNSQYSPLKGPHIAHGLTWTHFLWAPAPRQHLEGNQWHTGRNWRSGIQVRAEGQPPPRQNYRQWPLYLFWALPHREPQCGGTYLNLHQPGSHENPHPADYLRVHPIQLAGPPKQPSHSGNSGFSIGRAGLGAGFRLS